MDEYEIAKIVHEVIRQLCICHGDHSHLPWDDSPDHIRYDTVTCVYLIGTNLNQTPIDVHINWMDIKIDSGWVYGEIKDCAKKTHPSIVQYDKLSDFEKSKDYVFLETVKQLLQVVL